MNMATPETEKLIANYMRDHSMPTAQQGIRKWVDEYPGDPEALIDALILEIERLTKRATEDVAHIGDECRLRTAAKALLDDVRRRYPGEELRCPYMRELDAAVGCTYPACSCGGQAGIDGTVRSKCAHTGGE